MQAYAPALIRTSIRLAPLLAAGLLASCAATSLSKSWKAPGPAVGPVRNLALVAVDERRMVRTLVEGEFFVQLKAAGVAGVMTCEVLSLPEIKEDKSAAVAKVRGLGADSVLVVRFLNKQTYGSLVRQGSPVFAATVTGMGTGYAAAGPYYGWGTYYDVAYQDMSVYRGGSTDVDYLEANLYDLGTQKLLWTGVTKTTLHEDSDKVAAVKPFVTCVLGRLKTDGLIP